MSKAEQGIAVVKTIGVVSPSIATIISNWLGIISTGMTIIMTVLSIAFLLWRWRVAWKKENTRESPEQET